MSPARTFLETGTTAHTGLNCFAITCIADTVFTTLTGLSGDSLSAITFPSGVTIYGNFTAITLSSGKIIFYCGTAL